MNRIRQFLLFAGLFALVVRPVIADGIALKDGSVLYGEIQKATAGTFWFNTGYSPVVKIKQAEVTFLKTDKPVHVRMVKGSTLHGTLDAGPKEGFVRAITKDGLLNLQINNIRDMWMSGVEDPEVTSLKEKEAALRRKWGYTAGINFSGRQGNTEELGLSMKFGADLKGPQDLLKFYFSHQNSQRGNRMTADETKGGVDYSSKLVNRVGWYTRFELEKDKFEELDLRSTSAAGMSLSLLDRPKQSIGLRAGFAYRHESYSTQDNVEDPAIDFGLDYDLTFLNWFTLDTLVTYVPDFTNFGTNYRLTQDSGINIPLAKKSSWSVRLGLANEYNSQPVKNRKHLDSSYYTRLQFKWGD